jgi:tetratricopeptide (TPR) repeat protein
MRERVLGLDHPETAVSLSNLGLLLRDQGELAAARTCLERALSIQERVLPAGAPDLGSTLGALGAILWAQGDLASARPYFERALEVWQGRGERGREATAFFQLGGVALQLGRVAQGIRLVAVCCLINREIGDAATADDWQTLVELATQLGWSEADLESELRKVARAYQSDRGRGLLAAAFGDRVDPASY